MIRTLRTWVPALQDDGPCGAVAVPAVSAGQRRGASLS